MYIEVFVLMAIVLGGSALVYATASSLTNSSQTGPEVQITRASIRQGAGVAVETVMVANTGTAAVTSLTVATYGATSSASFTLFLVNPSTGSSLSSTCGAGINPLSVPVCCTLAPGQSIVAAVTIDSNVFAAGARYLVTVTTSPTAQADAIVVAGSA
jgi:hypothetical protein